MGSSCVADSRPWGVDCRDGSPGLFRPEVRGGRPRPGGAFPCSEVDASEPASTLGLGPGATGTAPVGLGGDFNESRRSSGDVWVPVDAVTGRAGPLRTTSAYPPFDKKENRFFASTQDTRLREAGVEAVYCLARGAPKGPNIPRAQLNHQGPLFPGHGYATHSQTWVGEPTWLGVRSDATHQAPTKVGAPCVRVWWPTWLGSVVTLLTKHLAPKVQAPPAELGVRGDATLQTPAFTGLPSMRSGGRSGVLPRPGGPEGSKPTPGSAQPPECPFPQTRESHAQPYVGGRTRMARGPWRRLSKYLLSQVPLRARRGRWWRGPGWALHLYGWARRGLQSRCCPTLFHRGCGQTQSHRCVLDFSALCMECQLKQWKVKHYLEHNQYHPWLLSHQLDPEATDMASEDGDEPELLPLPLTSVFQETYKNLPKDKLEDILISVYDCLMISKLEPKRALPWRPVTSTAPPVSEIHQGQRDQVPDLVVAGTEKQGVQNPVQGTQTPVLRWIPTDRHPPCHLEVEQCALLQRTPVYEKQGPKWCIASPGGPRRVQTYPGLGSTTRMPFSPDTGKPRTARRGRANPHGSGSVETPLSKHLLSQVPPAGSVSES
ncbi:hypothetical protein ISCGN_031695 [Ixodes scapularis]